MCDYVCIVEDHTHKSVSFGCLGFTFYQYIGSCRPIRMFYSYGVFQLRCTNRNTLVMQLWYRKHADDVCLSLLIPVSNSPAEYFEELTDTEYGLGEV